MDILTTIIGTLNEIEVKGKDNLNHLLACIRALEDLEAKISQIDVSDNKQESLITEEDDTDG